MHNALFEELNALHASHHALASFRPMPDDVGPQSIVPYHIPAADHFKAERGLFSDRYPALRDALVSASDDVKWRETYKGTKIDPDFMQRFGCYEVIGRDAPFASARMRSFMVYQPPHLHYPWHHHPAEELYVVLAGEAEFHLEGEASRTLRAGDHAFHPASRSHALTSHAHPVLAYVVWRDVFDTAPVWTDPNL